MNCKNISRAGKRLLKCNKRLLILYLSYSLYDLTRYLEELKREEGRSCPVGHCVSYNDRSSCVSIPVQKKNEKFNEYTYL